MILNFNIGLLGHVDSGKTTLARALSSIASTASFDKNPQSQERGITLDLGFSAVQVDSPVQLNDDKVDKVQLTFVDCPGHASLIRTIIGGAQIIDMMLLVIDAVKGVQTQTAECIVIGELLCRKLIVVVNKIDLLDQTKFDSTLVKIHKNLRKVFAGTTFGENIPIYNIAAQSGQNIQLLLNGICEHIYIPERKVDAPLILYVDHCFSVKGQGTVCTGTLIQGKIKVSDIIEIPSIREQRKVKSIQMFRCPVQIATAGDRIGLCVTQFNAKLLERGLITQPGYLQPIYAACILLHCIPYYKFAIKSKSKFHVTVGHETVMAKVTLFESSNDSEKDEFNLEQEYEYVDELAPNTDSKKKLYALLEFETAIIASTEATLIASKLDMDVHTNCCRLAFWGNIQWLTHSSTYSSGILLSFKIFKNKQKEGTIQRFVNEHEVIVQNLFKKDANRNIFVGKKISLSTGEIGMIDSTFGQTSKVKVNFPESLKPETVSKLKNRQTNEVIVLLRYRKFIFNKSIGFTTYIFVFISKVKEITRYFVYQKEAFHYNNFY